mmetsp:Transcript_23358/g.66408  ORF Transcript_23358/g.66408 Transcript_23358/m.66408 type:complete len:202 (-) Transcript_23358:128-733(-)
MLIMWSKAKNFVNTCVTPDLMIGASAKPRNHSLSPRRPMRQPFSGDAWHVPLLWAQGVGYWQSHVCHPANLMPGVTLQVVFPRSAAHPPTKHVPPVAWTHEASLPGSSASCTPAPVNAGLVQMAGGDVHATATVARRSNPIAWFTMIILGEPGGCPDGTAGVDPGALKESMPSPFSTTSSSPSPPTRGKPRDDLLVSRIMS